MTDVLRTYLDAAGKRRNVRSMSMPGRTMAALRQGHNLTPDHADGKITWGEWLSRRGVRGE
jgi:hypothetical protein